MTEPATPDDLIRLFIEEATSGLTSLPVSALLRCSSTVRHFGDNQWFEVTVTFSNNVIDGAYHFGERENAIWAEARCVGAEHSFALWEWSTVLGRVSGPWEGGDWVYEPERLRTIVQALTVALGELYEGIASASTAVHQQLLAAREERSVEEAAHARVREQERDEVQAAAAFRNGDYGTAAKLLRKHATHLSSAQQRKLHLAERKLPAAARDNTVLATIRVTAPAERVWKAITTPDALIQWYAPGCRWEIPELRAGATLRFFNSETDVQSAVIARCTEPIEFVLHWTPDARLPQTTLVNAYTISAGADGTTVTISQTGYASVPDNQRAAWIKADEGAFPAIAAALASYVSDVSDVS